ncbi:pentatricopeptide repeat-containing protein At4g02750-like [Selaginella moellendorffii]|uniref:pentatricopeptide repeat-containing protein At4g02750-like n=1 Tax=Selaginella moellendorffii TaxID=88036 RepID=UPI000D1C3F54|nr:pentatricopeptide repeat-containing protein At4g02750-like [Selaginella moellendorffii]|eukprot:XP_024532127.1 pentatricopeptide repeat-containing protein At4g02750-like [Selaginella moellendorffii]
MEFGAITNCVVRSFSFPDTHDNVLANPLHSIPALTYAHLAHWNPFLYPRNFQCKLLYGLRELCPQMLSNKFEDSWNMRLCPSEESSVDALARIVRECGGARDLLRGRSIHARILGSAWHGNRFLANLLVEMYGKCGSVEEARMVYDDIDRPNIFSATIMIAAYGHSGRVGEARMIFDGISASERDVACWNAMAKAYTRSSAEASRFFFQGMLQRNVVSWTAMLGACAENGHTIEAARIFQKMPHWDLVAWNAMIHAYAENGHYSQSKLLFDLMPQRDVISWTDVLASYAQAGLVRETKEVFDRTPEWSVICWNCLISAYAESGHLEDARDLFASMPERNTISWNAISQAFAGAGDLDSTKEIFDDTPHKDVVSWNSMIQAYASQGNDLEQAGTTFQRMPQWSMVSWNTIVSAYAQKDLLVEARGLFDGMPHRDVVSWAVMIAGHAQNGSIQGAKEFFDRMPQWSLLSCSCVLMLYAQNARLEVAREMFESIPHRDVVFWNSMIQRYAENGHAREALGLVELMFLEGVTPTGSSFVGALTACIHIGLVDRGTQYFVSMSGDFGLDPSLDHYCCVVDALGRAGMLEEAAELIEKMPFKADAVVWTTLLNSCRVHGNLEIGSRAGTKMSELQPESGVPYVLVSNIYAGESKEPEEL